MFKQVDGLQPKHSQAVAHEDVEHILIPACELGPERYREFRASKPYWRPRLYEQASCDEAPSFCSVCQECTVALSSSPSTKPHSAVECLGPSKQPKPSSISFHKLNSHVKMPVAENTASFQGIHSPVVLKATQQYANNSLTLEEMAMTKAHHPLMSSGRELLSTDNMVLIKPSNPEDDDSLHTDSERIKGSDFAVCPATSSSEDVSEDTMTAPYMEVMRSSEHAVCASPGDTVPSGKMPNLAGSVKLDESPFFVENEDLFKYVLATRQIPHGHSYSNLDIAMQRKLHDYFKQSCPPCSHCNSNTYVKFRYFNNSGKSSLLQPRFSCRNPDTCLTIQEKTGKAGSRDFTLPKPKECDMNVLAMSGSQENTNGQHEKSTRQPQMIQQCGSKRPAHNLSPLSETAERAAKLPNTTLSLQTRNESESVDAANLQLVEALKAKALQFVKPAEDPDSCSSIRMADDKKTAINVRCRAVETSDTGRLGVQPISVHQVGSISGQIGTVSLDKPTKGGKIAELNICMYIDLSTAS